MLPQCSFPLPLYRLSPVIPWIIVSKNCAFMRIQTWNWVETKNSSNQSSFDAEVE